VKDRIKHTPYMIELDLFLQFYKTYTS
jgi:hypothetical protein